ncbi:liver carboxylesterase 1F-like [Schistocerca americana]|uniref:liver carboxylesterase 1F-like n=1 Tax=Schistocerca americana TaxID=7009 RepID=UPI001F4FC0D0|nr:liver carboxylesterase 1F-like [Schistocerca americana]
MKEDLVKFIMVLVVAAPTLGVEVQLADGSRLLGVTSFSSRTRRPIHEFRGVPFARAPGGSHRFQLPRPVEPLGEFNANWFGPLCPQALSSREMEIPWFTWPDAGTLAAVRNLSAAEDPEDCLHLNVYTPKVDSSARLPVFVFVHGGSFTVGSSLVARPGFLLDHDMVMVVPEYRLGALGFLFLETEDAPGNLALWDVVEALRWTQKNVAVFGGDPSKVTLGGNSAGGALSELLAISPVADGLFQQVITVSGTAHAPWSLVAGHRASAAARRVAAFAGCNSSYAAPAVVACLRNRTLNNITIAYRQLCAADSSECSAAAAAVVQGSWLSVPLLERRPVDACEAGAGYKPRPALGGVTKHDGYYFARDVEKMGADTTTPGGLRLYLEYYFRKAFNVDYNPVISSAMREVFFKPQGQNKTANLTISLTDFIGATQFKGPLMTSADCNTLHGGKSYLYTYSHRSSFSVPAIEHAMDLVYLFPRLDYNLTKDEDKVSQRMVHLFANFIIYGDPSSNKSKVDNVPTWKSYTPERQEFLRIDWPFRAEEQFEREFTVTLREGLNAAALRLTSPLLVGLGAAVAAVTRLHSF